MRARIAAAVAALAAYTASMAPAQDRQDQLPRPAAQAVWNYLQQADYQSWDLWPGTERFYEGTRPHGALLTTYINPTAADGLTLESGELATGSIVVKENYTPQRMLDSVTIMYKAPGDYNPDANNWFWLKRLADGEIEAAGQVSSCQSCHETGERDYLMSALP